jgi:hypothetical protein
MREEIAHRRVAISFPKPITLLEPVPAGHRRLLSS